MWRKLECAVRPFWKKGAVIIGCGRKRHKPERNELRKLMLAMAAMQSVRKGGKGGQQEGSRLSAERETLARDLILKGSCFMVRHPRLIFHALRGAASSTWSCSAFMGESRSPVSELPPYAPRYAHNPGNAQEGVDTALCPGKGTPLVPTQRDQRITLQPKKDATGPSSAFTSTSLGTRGKFQQAQGI